MSRTFHNRPIKLFRNMHVQNRRKGEESVLHEFLELSVPYRHTNRINNYWSQIPEPYDDKPHASGSEYHNKNYWKKQREAANQPHFTNKENINDYSI